MTLKSNIVVFLQAYSYMVNAVPINNANLELESCKCVPYSTCSWSKKVYDLIQKGVPLNRLWNTYLCDSENQHVWCCENESGEQVYPLYSDLPSLKEIEEKKVSSSKRGAIMSIMSECADVGLQDYLHKYFNLYIFLPFWRVGARPLLI